MKESVSLTTDDQVEAFAAATQAVIEDHEAGLVDPDTYGGSVKRGEVLRVLAEAYLGRLDYTDHDLSGDAPDRISVPADSYRATTLTQP